MKLLTKQNLRDFAANAKLDEEARKPIVTILKSLNG